MLKRMVRGHKLVCLDIPNLDCSVQACGQNQSTVWAELNTVNLRTMWEGWGYFEARLHVPKSDLLAIVSGGDDPVVKTNIGRVDPAVVLKFCSFSAGCEVPDPGRIIITGRDR